MEIAYLWCQICVKQGVDRSAEVVVGVSEIPMLQDQGVFHTPVTHLVQIVGCIERNFPAFPCVERVGM